MLIARGFACEELLRIDRFCTDRAAWGDFAQGTFRTTWARGFSCPSNRKPKYERSNLGMESNKREYARPKPQRQLLQPLYD